MRRREFIRLIAGSTVAWPLAVRAQQAAMPLIGYLDSGSAEASVEIVAAFLKGLKEVGYSYRDLKRFVLECFDMSMGASQAYYRSGKDQTHTSARAPPTLQLLPTFFPSRLATLAHFPHLPWLANPQEWCEH
jgi:hypothetical protein